MRIITSEEARARACTARCPAPQHSHLTLPYPRHHHQQAGTRARLYSVLPSTSTGGVHDTGVGGPRSQARADASNASCVASPCQLPCSHSAVSAGSSGPGWASWARGAT